MTEIEKLAKEVAVLLRSGDTLMDEAECRAFFRVSATSFNAIKSHPRFPRPLKVPTTRGTRTHTHARWWRAEILEYAEQCREL
jgi:hypothetical protein